MHLFFYNATATTEIYTLSLHDALPIFEKRRIDVAAAKGRRLEDRDEERDVRADATDRELAQRRRQLRDRQLAGDRKSTRLNSSHVSISYAVFCLKKKKQTQPVKTDTAP